MKHLKKKKKPATFQHVIEKCKVSIVPNWCLVGKTTILHCGHTERYVVHSLPITHISKVFFEILLHIESVCLHVVHTHLSLFV